MNNDTNMKQHLSGYIDTEGKNRSEFDDVQHPQGGIVLMDGSQLECYPKEVPIEDFTPDEVRLDISGQYLSMSNKPRRSEPTDEEKEHLRKLFLDNAFYLLVHRERILSDSRMFLTPVAVQSGLAYTGTGVFRNPTVGVYLEWWMNCAGAMRTYNDGERSLVYRLAGSPLSGSNSCSEVLESGESRKVVVSSFIDCWSPFMKINIRYTEAKFNYQCYTLQQLLDILHQEDNGGSDYSHNIDIAFMQHEIISLNKKVEKLDHRSKDLNKKYVNTLMRLYDEKVREYYKEYETLKFNSETEIADLKEQKRNLKASLRSGKIDNVTYQRTLMPLNKRIGDIEFELSNYRYRRLQETFPGEEDITFDMISSYISKPKEQ